MGVRGAGFWKGEGEETRPSRREGSRVRTGVEGTWVELEEEEMAERFRSREDEEMVWAW